MNAPNVPVMTFGQYVFANKLVGDSDVQGHIHAGLRCAPTTKTYKKWYQMELQRLQDARDKARNQYQKELDAGTIRENTRIERLIKTANGHDDNASVRAARNILTKNGIDWKV